MLAKLNFSNSDKLTFPNSDVRTENCLILLLHMFSQLLGALIFFYLCASWQKCKQFKDPLYQLLFVTPGAWVLVCFPREFIYLEFGTTFLFL